MNEMNSSRNRTNDITVATIILQQNKQLYLYTCNLKQASTS